MPRPDPYEKEPTADLDPHTFGLYMEAMNAIMEWKRVAEGYQKELLEQLGDAHAGLVDGRKLVTNRPSDRWAEARLQKEYAELTQHYVKPKVTQVFDLDSFAASHPDIAEKYRVRSFRSVGDV
jgi:hypothetical protein